MSQIFFGAPWRCVLFIIVVLLGFSFTPAFLEHSPKWPPPEYEMKIQDPWKDMSTVPTNESLQTHTAKLTPRIFVPLLCRLFGLDAIGAVAIASIFNIGTLYMVWWFCRRRGKLDLATTTLCVAAAGATYAGATGFMDMRAYPFDGVAISLLTLGALLVTGRHWLALGIVFFLAMWTDERSLLTLPVYAILLDPGDREQPILRYLWATVSIGLAIVAYAVVRVILTISLGWAQNLDQVGLEVLITNLNQIPLGITYLFKAWWPLIIYGLYQAVWVRRHPITTLSTLGATASLGAAFLVLDISRSTAFLFPLIFLGIRELFALEEPLRMRIMLFILVANLVMGTYMLIGDGYTQWRLPMPLEWGIYFKRQFM